MPNPADNVTIDLGFGVLSDGLVCDRCRQWTRSALAMHNGRTELSICAECDVTP